MINKLKSRRKFKWVNSKPKFRLSQGIIMPIILLVVSIAMGIVIYNNINYSHLSTSVRDINSLHESVEDVNVGDIINYGINGNEEWKVVSVDKANNSMQVVSNKNVAEIEIGSDNYQNALEIFQEEL